MLEFQIIDKDLNTQARLGIVKTVHGEFSTPAFMPVGTLAAVKGVLPNLLTETGTEIVLSNTYHLILRPGVEVIEQAGGLHKFMSWQKPILTDSGGFQVYSLAQLRKLEDDGVTFSSHIDGTIIKLEPAEVIKIENRLGADIIMTFDDCPPWPVDFNQAEQAVNRTIRWAKICKETHKNKEQALFGIVQGSLFPELRERCLKELIELEFCGYALGGLSVGEEPNLRKQIVDEFAPKLPQDKPRYLMGVGKPTDIVDSVAAGVDMFDCVLPTRNGRNGYAFTSTGPIKLRNEQYKFDFQPIDQVCNCFCCRHFTRAYVRHLFIVSEMLGPILLSIHNITFFQQLMKNIREAIMENKFAELVEKIHNIWEDNPNKL